MSFGKMVLLGRFELPASSLPMKCSTPELQQPVKPLMILDRGELVERAGNWHRRYVSARKQSQKTGEKRIIYESAGRSG